MPWGAILGKRNHQIRVDKLGRLMAYMLGRRPDEFGLVPDSDGYVTFKELIQAFHEESGFRFVRRMDLNEVLLGKSGAIFQYVDNRIRAVERKWRLDLDNPSPSFPLPKILFSAVRRKAYPVIIEKGLKPPPGKHLILSVSEEMALRIGARRDQNPVLIEVMSSDAAKKGVLFYPFGDLFLSPRIPAGFISGPPLPKESAAEGKERPKTLSAPLDYTTGAFILNTSKDPDHYRRAKGKKKKGWKEAARKIRKR